VLDFYLHIDACGKLQLHQRVNRLVRRIEDIDEALGELKNDGFTIVALEQASGAVSLPDFESPQKLAIIVGREVEGVEPEVLAQVDLTVQIPMFGQKESFNVVQAAAMALYHCRFSH